MAGEVRKMNSSAINKQSAFRQVSVSNPPQRKAAKRYAACAPGRRTNISLGQEQ
jgi:hypothetical protein